MALGPSWGNAFAHGTSSASVARRPRISTYKFPMYAFGSVIVVGTCLSSSASTAGRAVARLTARGSQLDEFRRDDFLMHSELSQDIYASHVGNFRRDTREEGLESHQ